MFTMHTADANAYVLGVDLVGVVESGWNMFVFFSFTTTSTRTSSYIYTLVPNVEEYTKKFKHIYTYIKVEKKRSKKKINILTKIVYPHTQKQEREKKKSTLFFCLFKERSVSLHQERTDHCSDDDG